MKNFCLLFSLLLILNLYGCGKIDSIDTEKFQEIMLKNELTTADVTEGYSNTEMIDKVVDATVKDNYKIQFIKANTEEDAKMLFKINKEELESIYKTGTYVNGTVSDVNSIKFTLENDDYYIYLRQVDDTLLYVLAKKDSKKTVKKLINELGY